MPRARTHRQQDLQALTLAAIGSLRSRMTARNRQSTLDGQPFRRLSFSLMIAALLAKANASRDLIARHLCLSLTDFQHARSMIDFNQSMRRAEEIQTTDQLLNLLNTIEQLSETRALMAPPISQPRTTSIPTIFSLLAASPEAFMKWARMSKPSFDQLVNDIRQQSVFSANDSGHAQAPVEWQLLVALSYLGLPGSSSSRHIVAQQFSVSEGKVERYTNRCTNAIINQLEKDKVYWPSPEARADSTSKLQGTTVFDQCVGFVDGAIFPLASPPSVHQREFHTGKMGYAFNSILVCNANHKIIAGLHGWYGSTHDQHVYEQAQLYQQPAKFFSPGEYLLADSAFTPSATMIPAYHRYTGQSLARPKRKFNQELNEHRVAIDVTKRMLKNRWQSLKSIPLEITDKDSAMRLICWIRVCMILHNYLLERNETEWDELAVPLDPEHPYRSNDLPRIPGRDLTRQEQLLRRFSSETAL